MSRNVSRINDFLILMYGNMFGSKYGFIGKNGCGKSTLLKHIAAKILPIEKNMDILYVDQEIEPTDKSAFDTVIESNVNIHFLLYSEVAIP